MLINHDEVPLEVPIRVHGQNYTALCWKGERTTCKAANVFLQTKMEIKEDTCRPSLFSSTHIRKSRI